jgi:hypothetical protein
VDHERGYVHGAPDDAGRIELLRAILAALLAAAVLTPGQSTHTLTGVITDDECAKGDHSRMQMGPTDAECTVACINFHGATYVLYDGKETYKLSDQKTPEKYAGKKVSVTGTLDARTRTITVQAIQPAP